MAMGLSTAMGCGSVDGVGNPSDAASTGGTTAAVTSGSGGVSDSWFETTSAGGGNGNGGGADSSGGAPATTTDPGVDTDEPGEDDGEDSEGGVKEDEVGFFGFGTAMPGVSFNGIEGEFVAIEGGVEQCFIFWEYAPDSPPNDTCTECDFAFDLQRINVEVDLDKGCSNYLDVESLNDSTLSIGLSADGELYLNEGAGWEARGEGEFLPEKGNEFGWFYQLLGAKR